MSVIAMEQKIAQQLMYLPSIEARHKMPGPQQMPQTNFCSKRKTITDDFNGLLLTLDATLRASYRKA
jgi:hypothetical protein